MRSSLDEILRLLRNSELQVSSASSSKKTAPEAGGVVGGRGDCQHTDNMEVDSEDLRLRQAGMGPEHLPPLDLVKMLGEMSQQMAEQSELIRHQSSQLEDLRCQQQHMQSQQLAMLQQARQPSPTQASGSKAEADKPLSRPAPARQSPHPKIYIGSGDVRQSVRYGSRCICSGPA